MTSRTQLKAGGGLPSNQTPNPPAEHDAARALQILAPLIDRRPFPGGIVLRLWALGVHGTMRRELGRYDYRLQ